jgi:hypothetical protein
MGAPVHSHAHDCFMAHLLARLFPFIRKYLQMQRFRQATCLV